MENILHDFIQANSPDGGFLQSEYWKKFQAEWGSETHSVSSSDDGGKLSAYASIITHTLPVAGKYFYVPRGPVVKISNFQFPIFKQFLNDLIFNAKKNDAGWIRIEPNSGEEFELIRNNLPENIRTKKSAVDMQPREILILDISKSEKEILAGMKQKTRYNIKLSQKRGVSVKVISNFLRRGGPISKQYIEEFLRLVKITSERDKITAHPESYYRKMFESIPSDVLKLYVAEYEGKIISANLMFFFGKTATYLHGASDNMHRNVMAPYLLQWQQISDAKKAGCMRYDLGGVKTNKISNFKFQISNSWSGITKFKTGFAPNVEPLRFPGCYDIILKLARYNLYRTLQKIKRIF